MNSKEVKKLYSRSAGRCNICKLEVVEDKVIVGEMAHVIAKKKKGPRGELPFQGNLNSYENLILLCALDHLRVDGDADAYPPEKLHRIKDEHESWISQRLANHSKRDHDVAGLQGFMTHFPFAQIPSLLEFLPERSFFELVAATDQFDTFQLDFPLCHPFSDAALDLRFRQFSTAYKRLTSFLNGNIGDGTSRYGESHFLGNRMFQQLNSNLSYEDRVTAKADVGKAAHAVSVSYHDLADFLRRSYQDVNLTAYQP